MTVNKEKKKFTDYLMYNWWLVFLVFILSYSLWYYIGSLRTEYNDEEVFSIFITSYEWNDSLAEELSLKYKEEGIEQFNLYNFSIKDKDISSYYSNFGVKSDIVVLYEFDLVDMDEYIKNYFTPIKNLNSSYLEEKEAYSYNDIEYAIKVYDSDNNAYNDSYLLDFYTFDGDLKQDVYILINKSSVHFDETTDIGFKVLDYILKGE